MFNRNVLDQISSCICSFLGVVSSQTTNLRTQFNNSSELALGGPECGVCGTSYQARCLGFGAKGYPCECHLT